DRAEDLALDHLVVLLEPGDDRRLQVEARPVGLLAAGDDLGALRPALEVALDALALARRVDRAERRIGRERVADHEALRLLGESRDDVVVDLRACEHARRRRAVLTGVVVARAGNRLERAVEADV